MPQLVPLKAVPNQSLSIRLENRRYDIQIQQATGVMAATISRDSEKLVDSMRCVVGVGLLPYEYLEDNSGNFFFQTEQENLPDYNEFGITQFLYYFSDAELQELRDGA